MSRFEWIELQRTCAGAPPETQAPDAAPTDGPGCYHAARKLREAGYFEIAAKLYEKALGFDEHHYPTWVELIDSLVRAGRLAEADKQSQDALQNYRQVRVYYASRALVLGHQRRFADAMQHSDISVGGTEQVWYARCVRAEILLMQDRGYREEALRLLEEALSMSDDPWQTYFLGGGCFAAADFPTYAASFFAEAAHFNPRSFISWVCLGDAFHALRLDDQALFYYGRAAELNPDNEWLKDRMKAARKRAFGLLHAFLPVELKERWKKLSGQA
jgi:tetratricopeptide (TPR) repeat protein